VSQTLLSRPSSWLGTGKATQSYFRPQVEGLEDRITPANVLNLPLAADSVSLVNTATGPVLQAVVSLAHQATEVVTIAATTLPVEGEDCQILHLQLGPINLSLLGLHVDTSQICLDVTAHQGEGVLGDLLCGLTGGGLDLGGILGRLNGVAGQVESFIGQIDNLLDGVLGQPLNVDHVFGATDAPNGFCNVLNLSLGPVDLTLLGLNVSLDDCHGGPVTVDVTADPNGGLLGSLLCGLADGGLNGVNVGQLIGRIDNLIDRLTTLADRLGNLPTVGHVADRVEKLVDKLERSIGRIDSIHELDHLIASVEHTLDKVDQLIGQLV